MFRFGDALDTIVLRKHFNGFRFKNPALLLPGHTGVAIRVLPMPNGTHLPHLA